jgi:hypothetical protein
MKPIVALLLLSVLAMAIPTGRAFADDPTPTPVSGSDLLYPTPGPAPLGAANILDDIINFRDRVFETIDTISEPISDTQDAVDDTFLGTYTVMTTVLTTTQTITTDIELAIIDEQIITGPLTQSNPWSLMLGVQTIFQDIPWLNYLLSFFAFGFVAIITLEIIKLTVSLWGVVERLIQLVQVIISAVNIITTVFGSIFSTIFGWLISKVGALLSFLGI